MASYYLTSTKEEVAGVVILHLGGHLNDQTEQSFETLIREVTVGSPRLIIDAVDLIHISSIGFGSLLALTIELRMRGGDLRFALLSAPLRRALTLAFGRFFALHESLDEGVQSFDVVAAS